MTTPTRIPLRHGYAVLEQAHDAGRIRLRLEANGLEITLDPTRGRLMVGDVALPLASARVRVAGPYWVLSDGEREAPIGSFLGGPAASWLQALIDAASRTPDVASLEPFLSPRLSPSRVPPRVRELDPAPTFRFDHASAEVRVPQRTSWSPLWSLLFWVILPLFAPPIGVSPVAVVLYLVGWVGLGTTAALNVASVLRSRRRQHRWLRIDRTTLAFVEQGVRHTVALADIRDVHLAVDSVQVDRRNAAPLTVGHGWPTTALETL
ncbi:MAG: hypothetical protein AAF211_33240, partial [Myxococcota bacterium]